MTALADGTRRGDRVRSVILRRMTVLAASSTAIATSKPPQVPCRPLEIRAHPV